MIRSTYTYATMEVTQAVFDEVKARLVEADYKHALHDNGNTLDMHGLALVAMPERKLEGGTLEVGNDGRNVIVNHPDLKPDENGVGHIVFSAAQAEKFATLILQHAQAVSGKCEHRRREAGMKGEVCLVCGEWLR